MGEGLLTTHGNTDSKTETAVGLMGRRKQKLKKKKKKKKLKAQLNIRCGVNTSLTQ